MENVPKSYRSNITDKLKNILHTEIQKNNERIEIMKKNNFNRTSTKLVVYENKMNIYLHNNDFYNLYKYFQKYKKLAYEAIDEYLEKIEDDENYISMNYNFDTKIYTKNENAYLEFCNFNKNNIETYEDILNKLYLIYKNNL